jgi:cell division septation protein DedD
MAYDEDGYFVDQSTRDKYKQEMGRAYTALAEGRQHVPPWWKDKMMDMRDDLLGQGKYASQDKVAACAVRYAMLKAAKRNDMDMDKYANWWQDFQNRMGGYAGQGWGNLFGNQGMFQNMPGQPWMYTTGLGALGGYLLGNRSGNPLAGALLGGGLMYLLNNWAKQQYEQQQGLGASGAADKASDKTQTAPTTTTPTTTKAKTQTPVKKTPTTKKPAVTQSKPKFTQEQVNALNGQVNNLRGMTMADANRHGLTANLASAIPFVGPAVSGAMHAKNIANQATPPATQPKPTPTPRDPSTDWDPKGTYQPRLM